MTEFLYQLIAFIKEISPEIWQVLIKQVYVEAYSRIAWALVLLISSVASARSMVYCRAHIGDSEYNDEWYLGTGLSAIFSIMFIISCFALVISAARMFANPEFVAIKFILDNLGRR